MNTPQTGDRVRLVATCGVSSPAMREQLGKTGTVLGARREGSRLLVHARFPTPDGVDDQFWLKPTEYQFVETPPAPTPPVTPPQKETRVDFATTLRRELDRLSGEDAEVAVRMTELAARRGAIGRERRALEAARAAYQRVQATVTESRAPVNARAAPAVPFLRRWAADHGGEVVLAAATDAALAEGLYGSAQQAQDRLIWALRKHAVRTGKGVYRIASRADEEAYGRELAVDEGFSR